MKFLGVELQSTFVYNQQGPRRNSTKPIPKILHLPILTPQRQVQYLFFYQFVLSFYGGYYYSTYFGKKNVRTFS